MLKSRHNKNMNTPELRSGSKKIAECSSYLKIIDKGSIVIAQRDVCAYENSLTSPCFIKVPATSQESELSCMCVYGVSIFALFFTIFDEMLELFRQCSTFCFWFNSYQCEFENKTCLNINGEFLILHLTFCLKL
jgi:hypothetical protein